MSKTVREVDLRTVILELIEQSIELVRSHAIWYALVQPDNRSNYEAVIRKYEDFFEATANAHFQTVIIIVYQLFDKRPSTKSFRNVINRLESDDPSLAQRLRGMLKANLGLLKRLFELRLNVYAHRNAKLCPKDIFARVRVSPGVMTTVLALVEQMASLLAEKVGIDSATNISIDLLQRADHARADFTRIMMELQSSLSQ